MRRHELTTRHAWCGAAALAAAYLLLAAGVPAAAGPGDVRLSAESEDAFAARGQLLLLARVDPVRTDIEAVAAELAKADGAATGGSVATKADAAGVPAEGSTWSDLTAVFRPSRWKRPLRAGGALSWLNYKSWGEMPGRTTKVLVGELLLLGFAYGTVELVDEWDDDDDDKGGTSETTTTTTTRRDDDDEELDSFDPEPPGPPPPPPGP